MPNPYIPRDTVHAWSEDIGEKALDAEAGLQRVLKDQRRLTRFVEENGAALNPASGGVCVYLFGVVARMFDLAGGRLKNATWAHVRAAEAKVGAHAAKLLPYDEGFKDRVRAIEDRAQPHILDEALMALFDRDDEELGDDEVALDDNEAVKVFFLLWVATEVLDGNWKPPSGFEGETSYTYVHIEPKKKDKA